MRGSWLLGGPADATNSVAAAAAAARSVVSRALVDVGRGRVIGVVDMVWSFRVVASITATLAVRARAGIQRNPYSRICPVRTARTARADLSAARWPPPGCGTRPAAWPEHRGDVHGDGLGRDEQVFGDLGVAAAQRHESQHLAKRLAAGEAVRRVAAAPAGAGDPGGQRVGGRPQPDRSEVVGERPDTRHGGRRLVAPAGRGRGSRPAAAAPRPPRRPDRSSPRPRTSPPTGRDPCSRRRVRARRGRAGPGHARVADPVQPARDRAAGLDALAGPVGGRACDLHEGVHLQPQPQQRRPQVAGGDLPPGVAPQRGEGAAHQVEVVAGRGQPSRPTSAGAPGPPVPACASGRPARAPAAWWPRRAGPASTRAARPGTVPATSSRRRRRGHRSGVRVVPASSQRPSARWHSASGPSTRSRAPGPGAARRCGSTPAARSRSPRRTCPSTYCASERL